MNIQEANAVLAAVQDIIDINVSGLDTLSVQVFGAMSATLLVEGTVDGRNWVTLNVVPSSSATPATSITAAGVYFANVSALLSARVRCSAYVSGNPTIMVRAINGTGAVSAGTGASESHFGEVGGNMNMVSTEFTRPSDTTAYTAGDVVSNATSSNSLMVMTDLARINGGTGYIVGCRLSTDKKSITPRFRVHLFSATDPTFSVDNVAYKDLYADGIKRLGYFDLPAMITSTDTTNSDMSRSIDLTLRLPYKAASNTKSIYALLETLDAFTPASAEKFTLILYADNN
jgi:hypothetical protein